MFGFNIESDLDLLKLQTDGGSRTLTCYEDRAIQSSVLTNMSGLVGENQYGTILVYLHGTGKFISIKDMGCFFVEGTNITYHITSPAFSEAAVCIVIGTHILGNILLPQHYLLHATTVIKTKTGKAVALMGVSGTGKSTMALSLLTRCGYSLLSEDMSVLCLDKNDIVAKKGLPYVKAWDDTIQYLEHGGIFFGKIANVYKTEKKQILDIRNLMWKEPTIKLDGIIILKRSQKNGESPRILTNVESYISLMENHYIGYSCTMPEHKQQARLLRNILLAGIPVYTFSYPNGYEYLDEAASALDKFISNLPRL